MGFLRAAALAGLVFMPVAAAAQERPAADLVWEFYDTHSVPAARHSADLAKLFEAEEALAEKERMGNLDFDWLTGGQDEPQIEDLWLETISRSAERESVRATFKNYGEERVRTFHFVLERGDWAIDDVMLDQPENLSLSALLAGQ